jgi:hypothetical protein
LPALGETLAGHRWKARGDYPSLMAKAPPGEHWGLEQRLGACVDRSPSAALDITAAAPVDQDAAVLSPAPPFAP